SGSNGQPVAFSGIPVTGATFTVAQATATPTNTATFTPTSTITLTSTPTAVTVAVSQGSNPPVNSSQLAGDSNVAGQQNLLVNPSPSTITLTQLILSVSGTGNPANVTGATLYANGVPVATAIFAGNTAVFSLSGMLPASSGSTYTVTVNFGPGAAGTYS